MHERRVALITLQMEQSQALLTILDSLGVPFSIDPIYDWLSGVRHEWAHLTPEELDTTLSLLFQDGFDILDAIQVAKRA